MNNTLTELNQKFAIEGAVSIKQNANSSSDELLYLDINNKFCSAKIQIQGAHLTAWTPGNNEAVIWLSDDVNYSVGKSIRGGIPICWPWFGAHQSNSKHPAHGFARTVLWEIASVKSVDSGETLVVFNLPDSNETTAYWPYNTSLKCIFTIGQTLTIELITINNSSDKIDLGEAFHSYFNVSDINNIVIQGLDGCDYLDKLENFKPKKQTGKIQINTEVDRIYTSTTQDCIIEDSGFGRRIHIAKKSSLSTIIWNPGLQTATKMADLGDNGYLKMICVESGNAANDIVAIEPDQRHSLMVEYSVSEIV